MIDPYMVILILAMLVAVLGVAVFVQQLQINRIWWRVNQLEVCERLQRKSAYAAVDHTDGTVAADKPTM